MAEINEKPRSDSDDADEIRIHGSIARVQGNSPIENLLEHCQGCVQLLDASGTLDFVDCGLSPCANPGACRALGQRKWWNLWPEELQPRIRSQFEAARGGTETTLRTGLLRSDGQECIWEVNLRPMTVTTGGIAGVMCVLRSIQPGD